MGVLDRKLLRVLRDTWGQALAVALVILCGTATLVSLASAHRNLLLTRDTYYAQNQFADFTIMLERAPRTAVFKVEEIRGVRRAKGRIVQDVNLDIAGQDEPRTGRIISLPMAGQPTINAVTLMSGRGFSSPSANEAIVSDAFAQANGLEPGDHIRAAIANRKQTLRIVGTGLSPEYVYMIRNAQEFIPSPERFGVLWVPEDYAEMAFDLSAACNDIVGLVDDPAALERILDEAGDVLEPYGVFARIKRADQISNRFLSDEIAGLEVSAKITPAIFMGIAALILLVLLNRMVRNERTQIGLLKAYGYRDWEVALHYLKYALAIAAAGWLGGSLVGIWLAAMMIELYVQFYSFPVLRAQVYWDELGRALLITLAFAGAGALQAIRRIVRISPAESMRPEAPTFAHRTLLERVDAIWRRLSFTSKMTVRNVSRYRTRAAINIFGVMVSAGILLIGYFSMDAVTFMINYQFRDVQREDVRIALETERGKGAYYDVRRLPYVRYAEPQLQYPFELRNGWRKKDVAVSGVPPDARLFHMTDIDGRRVDVGQSGIVLTERLAQELGAEVGTSLRMEPLIGRVDTVVHVPVRQVVRQYMGMGAYMHFDTLSRILDEPFVMNAALVVTEPGAERRLSRELKDATGVAAVEIKSDVYQSAMDTLAASMAVSNTMLMVFAGIIAFAIIYNSTMVSLAERQRELASLRVLGFTEQEVGRILYRENYLLGSIGLALGIPFGMGLCKLLVEAYDTELYRMPFHIETRTYYLTAALTAVYIVLANLAVRRRIRRLDMIEVLKSRE